MFSKEEIRETLDEIRHPVSIALWGSENYFNAGSAIRTAHTFLIDKIYLIDCPAVYERAAMGCEKFENIIKISTQDFIDKISKTHTPIVAFERRADLIAEYLPNFVYPKNPILLFGCEKFGIPDELLEIAAYKVTVPQYGIHNDMNLGNVIAIAVYDWLIKNT